MPKPTLIQTLLGHPSQSYSFSPRKNYHSSKNDLIRVAATSNEFEEDRYESASGHSHRVSTSTHTAPANTPTPRPRTLRFRRKPRPPSSPVHLETAPELLPSRSFIRQIASSNSSLQKQNNVRHHDASPTFISRSGSRTPSDRRPVDLAFVAPALVDVPVAAGDSPDDNSDVFYTPASSLVPSPRSSCTSEVMLVEPHALTSALLPLKGHPNLKSSLAPPAISRDPYDVDLTVSPGPASRTSSEVDSAPVSRTPSDSSISSCSAASVTASVSEPDVASIFDSNRTTSTRVTTPVDSELDHAKSDEGAPEAITIISSSRKPRPLSIDLSPSSLRPWNDERAFRRHSQPITPPRTDEDWAKDVRWLVPPSSTSTASSRSEPTHSSRSTRRRSRPLHPDLLPPPLPMIPAPHQLDRQTFLDIPTVARPAPVRPRPKEHRPHQHSHRHSRGRMSALWEEDESECSTDVGASSAEVSRASTPAPMPFAEGYLSVEGSATRSATPPQGWPSAGVGAGAAAMGNGPLHPKARTVSSPIQDKASMSESELHAQLQYYSRSQPSSPMESPDSMLQDYARLRGPLRPLSWSDASTPSSGPSNTSLPTHSIPAPFPSSIPGARPSGGYTSLILPHAAYTSKNGKPLADGRIDLVRSGRAQSSMATIEVVRGAASVPSSTLSRTRNRLSRSFSLGKSKERQRADNESATPAHLRASLPLSVSFTSHIAPPSFVPPSRVLVQVFAVGLDGLDSLIVQERAERRGAGGSLGRAKGKRRGFVPGRSFVGRVVECGFEVSRDTCKRGEWVLGLLSIQKCGALAEFILVERHRVIRSPQPCARPTYLFPPRRRVHARTISLPSSAPTPSTHQPHSPSPLVPPTPPTLEELALIPLCGLPAYRAVRSFADVLVSRSGKGRERPRVLILMGHDGPGAVALQMLGRRGARVCVQVTQSAISDADDGEVLSDESARPPASSKQEKVEARLRSWGADEVYIGDPLSVLEHLLDEERSFDAVLDTVGGVCIWEAAQRLLAASPASAMSQSAPALSSGFLSSEDPSAQEEDAERHRKASPSHAQFTTLVGDMPSRAIPKAQDNLRSGLRSLRRAMSPTSSPSKGSPASTSRVFTTSGKGKVKRIVGYTWISAAADVDEGEDVRDSLSAVVDMVVNGVVRPWVSNGEEGEEDRVLPFEQAPEAFRRDAKGPRGMLKDGGTCVVRIGV